MYTDKYPGASQPTHTVYIYPPPVGHTAASNRRGYSDVELNDHADVDAEASKEQKNSGERRYSGVLGFVALLVCLGCLVYWFVKWQEYQQEEASLGELSVDVDVLKVVG